VRTVSADRDGRALEGSLEGLLVFALSSGGLLALGVAWSAHRFGVHDDAFTTE